MNLELFNRCISFLCVLKIILTFNSVILDLTPNCLNYDVRIIKILNSIWTINRDNIIKIIKFI